MKSRNNTYKSSNKFKGFIQKIINRLIPKSKISEEKNHEKLIFMEQLITINKDEEDQGNKDNSIVGGKIEDKGEKESTDKVQGDIYVKENDSNEEIQDDEKESVKFTTEQPFAKISSSIPEKIVNLTETGEIDWIQFRSSNIEEAERKNNEKAIIDDIIILEDNKTGIARDTRTNYIYIDGNSDNDSPEFNNTGIIIYGKENGVQFNIPYIDDNERSISIYVGSWESKLVVEGYINNEIIPAVWDMLDYRDNTLGEVGDAKHKKITINYNLVNPDDKLQIKIFMEDVYDKQYGNLTLQAISLK